MVHGSKTLFHKHANIAFQVYTQDWVYVGKINREGRKRILYSISNQTKSNTDSQIYFQLDVELH
jgi:hypothetical protein